MALNMEYNYSILDDKVVKSTKAQSSLMTFCPYQAL
jgi:hypothetical protein